ncbi:MAG: hypothetical protein ACYS8X_12365 [Planctomycetota bacterium]|jgi:hypothetical protein
MRLSKKLIGRPVEVRFADHCEGGLRPMETIAYGRLIQVARTHIVIASWIPLDSDASDDSHTRWSIVRSAISKLTPLTPVEKTNPPANTQPAPHRGNQS